MLPGFTVNRRLHGTDDGRQGTSARPRSASRARAPFHRPCSTLRDRLRLSGSLVGGQPPPAERKVRGVSTGGLKTPLNPLARASPSATPDQLVARFQGSGATPPDPLGRPVGERLSSPWSSHGVSGPACVSAGELDRGRHPAASDLLCSGGGMVSAEPARRVVRNGPGWQRHDDDLLAASLQQEDTLDPMRRHCRRFPEFRTKLTGPTWTRFGERCTGRAQTGKRHSGGTITRPLLRAIAALGRFTRREGLGVQVQTASGAAPGCGGGAGACGTLRQAPAAAGMSRWVLKYARNGCADRENLRYERTRVFGRVRTHFP